MVTAALATKLLPPGFPANGNGIACQTGQFFDGTASSIASLGVAVYAAFVALGLRVLSTKRSHIFEAAAVLGLFFASVCIQVIIPMGAPSGYDLTKWAVGQLSPGFERLFPDRQRKSRSRPMEIPGRLSRLDSKPGRLSHRHPPTGLDRGPVSPAAGDGPESTTDSHASRSHAPPRSTRAFASSPIPTAPPLSRADRAALFATALLTLLACAGTVVPLYLLARAALPAPTSWAAAALWPLAPSANLFQPVADTAYPLLSTTALALAVWALRSAQPKGRYVVGSLLALASGMVMAFGMSFTLAFLPVGLIVALTLIATKSASPKARALLDSRHRRRLLLVPFRSLGSHVRQSLRHRVLESQASRAVLRRVPANLLALALGQPDRDGDRHRRALRPSGACSATPLGEAFRPQPGRRCSCWS